MESTLLRVHDQVHAIGIARRICDADTPKPITAQAISFRALPCVTTVTGFIQTAARTVRRRINVPRWTPCLPHGGENLAIVLRIESEVDRTGVVVGMQHEFPSLAAVCAAV